PKSNSGITAIDAALSDIRKGHVGQIRNHLKDGHYSGAKALGRAIGYKYPHNYDNGFIAQQYLPYKLQNKIYYTPKTTSKTKQQLKSIFDYINKSQENAH